jgi:AcrR family transcriptional regulator
VATDNSRATGRARGGGGRRGRPTPPDDALKHLVDEVTEKVTEKVHAKVQAKVQAKVDTLARKYGATPPDVVDLWTREEPGSRRPRFTREDISSAAVRIADTEGIDALSMRRLAQELGSGTMTLYHYVRTKDELLMLVMDTVMAEVVVPEDALPADDWRAAITAIAHSSRDALERHPWVFDIVDDPGAGPNGVRHFDQSMQAVASLPGSLDQRLDVIFAVDEYVFGYCLHRRDDRITAKDQGTDAMRDYVGDLVSGGGYPTLAALVAEHGLDAMWSKVEALGRDEQRFDRTLSRLLDGIAATLTG